ncbi:hypothetical protein Nepgr_026536 [Nepenthes gracilis]|uniref:Uncharacterized protein n=1 Tax=Nepenthes gracilis TaxID=150966 RepID=A0AAD3T7C0_NEPGR|nr:hypothetical protein Nepgr_026536 [Nepenthes gracilis]
MNRIKELEAEIERLKQSEAKLFDSYAAQTTQLEQATILLEKSKLENADLRGKVRSSGEMVTLKNELRLAMEAEEKGKKAMDDLAMALKEVSAEANQAKEKLSATEAQLQIVKEEADRLKSKLKSLEDNYKTLLNEAKEETDRWKNTADRHRIEAEESLLAWNVKEIEFLRCIENTEDEKTALLEENSRLRESLSAAEAMEEKARDDNQKLRDILKQALNEANVAKEAAEIARAENSQLKDSLAEKDEALAAIAEENESLKLNEAAANEIIKELKWFISSGSMKDLNTLEKPLEEKEEKKSEKDYQKGGKRLSFDLKEVKLAVPGILPRPEDIEGDVDKDDAVTDSMFNLVGKLAKIPHNRRTSSAFSDDGKAINLEEFNQQEVRHLENSDINKSSQSKRRVLLRKFGDVLRKKKP